MRRDKEVRFVLKETLDKLGITGNRLAVEAKIRPHSIYDILENRKKTISLEYLTSIRNALNSIASEEGIKQRFDIQDILK